MEYAPATARFPSRGNCILEKYISALNYAGERKFRKKLLKIRKPREGIRAVAGVNGNTRVENQNDGTSTFYEKDGSKTKQTIIQTKNGYFNIQKTKIP
ncbi:MAG: hypothetical protein RL699_1766 [Bacteroidota bacterium]